MHRCKTHFERIPLESLRTVLDDTPDTPPARNDNAEKIEAPTQKSLVEGDGIQQPWRELAKQVQSEQNPVKMTALVEKLLEALEGQKLAQK
jgi:hypothetical protein